MILKNLIKFLEELERLGREQGWTKEVSADDATRTITVRFLDNNGPVPKVGTIHASYEAIFDNNHVDIYAKTVFERLMRTCWYTVSK